MDKIEDKQSSGKRPAPYSYRPPEKLREEFASRVANSDMSINAFITKSIFGGNRSSIDDKNYAHLLHIMARFSGHIGDAKKECKNEQTLKHLEKCDHDLAEFRSLVMKALGKRSPLCPSGVRGSKTVTTEGSEIKS